MSTARDSHVFGPPGLPESSAGPQLAHAHRPASRLLALSGSIIPVVGRAFCPLMTTMSGRWVHVFLPPSPPQSPIAPRDIRPNSTSQGSKGNKHRRRRVYLTGRSRPLEGRRLSSLLSLSQRKGAGRFEDGVDEVDGRRKKRVTHPTRLRNVRARSRLLTS